MEDRGSFRSRLGFLLVSAGCAIGIGNVWKFPYICGEYGGAVFVLFYLAFLVLMGIPVMTMELAVGRGSRKSAVLGYKRLEPEGSLWHIHGWFALAGCYLLMMYYTTVSGWMLSYFWKFLTGVFSSGMSAEGVPAVFGAMLASPWEMGIFMALTVVLGFAVCGLGLHNGVERITKWMMLCLLFLIIVLAVHSIFLPGGEPGLTFYLLPDWNRAVEAGIGNVASAAMNQAFFTLSLGVGALEIFGSYMSDDFTLTGEAVRITLLDTFVAIMAGLIIFPACFAYDVQPDQGPSLIFITLPRIFLNMTGGQLWGTLFFVFMTFASFSTVTAVFENLISCSMDNFGWSRKKAVIVNLIAIFILSIPCVLGYNVLKGQTFIGARDVLDSEDFLVSNILLPGGALIYLLFCVSRWGWGFEKYAAEVNKGVGLKMPLWVKPYFRYILPVLILVILIRGLI
jgi:NSS family neurotransmitter:Na+ symporter